MYAFFPGNIYKHFMVNTEEIIMTHTEDTQLMTTHVLRTSYLVRKKVWYTFNAALQMYQINSILKIKNGGNLRWATTTCCPHVCLFSSQLFMYTLPLLPHTGPSRTAPVQDSGHIWNILNFFFLVFS